jgi:hypothetical protein
MIRSDRRFTSAISASYIVDLPPRRRAARAGAGESGLDDQRRRVGHLGRVPHDDGVVAAHFQRDDLVRPGGELAVDRDAGVGGAGEQHPVHPFVGDQLLAFLRPADQQLDHGGGDAGAVEALQQQFARRRGLFRRLEDDGVARDQRRDNVAIGQVRREIVRPQHRHDPMRLVAHGGGPL